MTYIRRIDFQKEYFCLINAISGPHYVMDSKEKHGFIFCLYTKVYSDPLIVDTLETLKFPYDIFRVRGLDAKLIYKRRFSEGWGDTELKDQPIREFTDEEKALIMRYKIEGGG